MAKNSRPDLKRAVESGRPGCISLRQNRITKKWMGVYLNPPNARLKYRAVCEADGGTIFAQNLNEAYDAVGEPQDWCPGCGGTDYGDKAELEGVMKK